MGQDKTKRQGDELENISVVQTRSEGTKASSVGEEGIRHMRNIPGGIDRVWFTDMRRSEGEERVKTDLVFSNHTLQGILISELHLPSFSGLPHFPEFAPNDI